MKKLILIIAIFVCIPAQAAIPTMEGLFRNGKNKDLAGNFVILKMMVDEMSLTDDLEKKVSYLKFYFSVADENRIEFLQVHYPDGEMRKDSATHLYYAHNCVWRKFYQQTSPHTLDQGISHHYAGLKIQGNFSELFVEPIIDN